MEIRIKTTDYQMTSETSAYLDARLATLEKMIKNADVARCEVELGRDAGRERHGEHTWFAEITLHIPGEATVRATNHAPTINTAIDDVKEEIERQLRRQKQSRISMLRRGGARIKQLLRLQK